MAQPPVLYSSSQEDLAASVRAEVRTVMLELLPEAFRRSRLGAYLNDEEAGRESGLTKRQLRHLRQTGRITFVKRGQLLLYPTDEFFRWLDEGRVPAREG